MSARLEPASSLSTEALAGLLNACFSGYYVPMQVTPEGFGAMVSGWDLDLAGSCVAYHEDAPAALALIGVRGAFGWIGGMGVVPEARRQGLGRVLMESVIAYARARHLVALDLEVLEQNAPAIPLYLALGFRDVRVLDVWTRPPGPPPGAATPEQGVTPLPVEECLEAHAALHVAPQPWQRDLPTLAHQAGRSSALGLREARGAIAACAIYRAEAGKLQLADVGRTTDAPPDALERVLRALLARHPDAALTLVNLPAEDPAAPALAALGAAVWLRQREMRLAL